MTSRNKKHRGSKVYSFDTVPTAMQYKYVCFQAGSTPLGAVLVAPEVTPNMLAFPQDHTVQCQELREAYYRAVKLFRKEGYLD